MLWWSAAARAATWLVDPAGAGDFLTVQDAVDAAYPGDTILVNPGDYPQGLLLEQPLTLRATGPVEATTLRGGVRDAVVLVYSPDVVLTGFRVTSDDARHCLRVWTGHLTFQDGLVEACNATDGLGGGLRVEAEANATVSRSTFRDNRAEQPSKPSRGAHVYFRGDHLRLEQSLFERGETATGDGAALFAVGGVVEILGCTFRENSAGDDGGALYLDGNPSTAPDGSWLEGVQQVRVFDSTFQDHYAADRGGLIFADQVPALEIRRVSVCGARAGYRGGLLHAVGSHLTAAQWQVQAVSAVDRGAFTWWESGSFNLDNLTLVDIESAGDALVLRGSSGALGSPLVAYGQGTFLRLEQGATLPVEGGLFWELAGGPGDLGGPLVGDPQFQSWSDNGQCDDDLHLRPGSAGRDVGAPRLPDLDGSAGDAGVFGGPGGLPCLFDGDRDGDGAADGCDPCPDEVERDADGDRSPSCQDCDDADPRVRPGAADPVGDGLDQDCSGADGP